jgi:hypothetical protein
VPKLSRAVHAMLASGQINRRTANHIQWEADNPQGAVKARVGGGRTQAARGRRQADDGARRDAGQRVTGGRRVRNNFREY